MTGLDVETTIQLVNQYATCLAGTVEYTDCTSAEGLDPSQRVAWYDTKKSDGEVPVMLELWGMRSTPSFQSLSGLLRVK